MRVAGASRIPFWPRADVGSWCAGRGGEEGRTPCAVPLSYRPAAHISLHKGASPSRTRRPRMRLRLRGRGRWSRARPGFGVALSDPVNHGHEEQRHVDGHSDDPPGRHDPNDKAPLGEVRPKFRLIPKRSRDGHERAPQAFCSGKGAYSRSPADSRGPGVGFPPPPVEKPPAIWRPALLVARTPRAEHWRR